MLDSDASRATGTGEDRNHAFAGIHRRFDDVGVFLLVQREELTGAARSKQGAGAIRSQPFQALDVSIAAEFALYIKIGHWKGQQSG
ncbi:hypothetical protein GCM10009425_03750 [Pseudomonas asuensis]|uniref:Uncharacterized protein n=1 Tax=Pseudomonas asuensis TaxID=1825787 RepID=A0ABQ2GHQ8_9PSED|nr:hypothetical protein GCM10009425_03750 [Pseudomonas asuensis]